MNGKERKNFWISSDLEDKFEERESWYHDYVRWIPFQFIFQTELLRKKDNIRKLWNIYKLR